MLIKAIAAFFVIGILSLTAYGTVSASHLLDEDYYPILPSRSMNENVNFPTVRPPITRSNLFEEGTDVSWLIIPGDFLLYTGVGEGTAIITLPEYVTWAGNFGGVTPVVFEKVDWGTPMPAGNLRGEQAVSIDFTVFPGPENEIRITFNEYDLVAEVTAINNPNFILLPLRADFTEAPTGMLQAIVQVLRTGTTHNTNIPVSTVAVRSLGAFTAGTLPPAASHGPVALNTWSIGEGVAGNFFAGTPNTEPLRGFTVTLGPTPGQFIFVNPMQYTGGHVSGGLISEGFHINFPNRGANAQLPVFATHEQGFLWAFNASKPYYHSVIITSFDHAAQLPASSPERIRFDAYFVHNNAPIINPVTGEILNLLGPRPRSYGLNYAFISHGGARLNVVLSGNNIGTALTTAGALQIVNARMNSIVPVGAAAVQVTAVAANRYGLPNIPSATQNVFRFSAGGLSVTATTATQVVSGLTFTPGLSARQVFSIEQLPNVTARVNIVENTPQSGFSPWNAPTLTLTNADGVPLNGVSIAGVQMGGNLITGGATALPTAGLAGLNRHLHNMSNPLGDGINATWLSQGANATLAENVLPSLTENSLTFHNLPMASRELGLAVAFRLSIAPHFTGGIYLTVSTRDEVLSTVRIANAVAPVEVIFTTRDITAIPVGVTPIGDITIRERAAGALMYGQITIDLNAWGIPSIDFAAVTSANIRATNGLFATVSHGQGHTLTLNVLTPSIGQAGEIVLSDLRLVRLLPLDIPVDITIGGTALQDNTYAQLNPDNSPIFGRARYAHAPAARPFLTLAAPQTPQRPTPPEREANEEDDDENGEAEEAEQTPQRPTPPMPPRTPAPPLEPPIVRLTVNSPIVRVGELQHILLVNTRGELTPIRSYQSRIFIPARGLVPILYGEYDFVWEDGLWVYITIGNTTARFTQGSTRIRIQEQDDVEMSVAPLVVDGSLYLPLRYFADVFDVSLTTAHIEGEFVVYLNKATEEQEE
ncbi:MAG: stalk domain-containing protein [Defluviitaleaceae bacterium]|nr:stalk domain-containing protein [Defluviitaleaceae bacterium]MCL2276064.1 stalk domain-containing protein [Defluviitaleaceae bacterium]